VHLRVALVADPEPAEVVQVSEAALDDPALFSEAGAVGCSTTGDDGCDPERSQKPTVLVVVIATVGQEPVGLLAWPTALAGHCSCVEVFQQWDQLGDVVAIPAGQGDRQRNAASVDQQMVL
jgi:hypothetical protein